MSIDPIDIDTAVKDIERQLAQEQNLSPALVSSIKMLLLVVKLMANRLGLNSRNSSKPPASDPNREKKSRQKGQNKPGGQQGRVGKTLEKFEQPDETQQLTIDRRTLPHGHYTEAGHEIRQVVEIDFTRWVIEYQAQVLMNERGQRFVAEFPSQVTRPIQYGSSIKAHCVYLSQFQLLPYNRIADYFADQLGLPISEGSIYNFNQEAADRINRSGAEAIIKQQLQNCAVLHVDETGINIGGKRHWLHSASNLQWTYFYPHPKRGVEAMASAEILAHFTGILCHDHWTPYYTYQNCQHALCNAHHLRELERAWEQDGQQWARSMRTLLIDINGTIRQSEDPLAPQQAKSYRAQYRKILKKGDKECPPPDPSQRKSGQRGRLKRSKARCLLDRLIEYENDVLRFMENASVPFTNNLGENDIRMTKVQQKISGCFRSMEGAHIFCLVRSYISSCRKQNVTATEALNLLFQGELPIIFC